VKGIDKARADLAASKASGEHAAFMEHAGPLATIAGTLRAAQAMIETCGFSSGANNVRGYCASVDWRAVGMHEAIVRCMGARQAEAIAHLAIAIGMPDKGSIGIETWANRYGRTTEHVLAAFDRAIELADSSRP
jgi:hypothetical protein